MKPIRVFISSALDELEHEREIARATVERLNLFPVLFEGLPPTSKALEETYLDEVRDCDLFVVLLWKTFRPPVKKELEVATFYRKPILVLLKDVRGDEVRSDELAHFLGALSSDSQADESREADRFIPFYKPFRSLSSLDSLLAEGLSHELGRLLRRTITTTHSRLEMYELGRKIATFAKHRLYVIQRTPLLLLGAREYLATRRNKVWYEQALLEAFNNWIDRTVEDSAREFVYLFDLEATRSEIVQKDLQKLAAKNLRKLKNQERLSGRRFRFLPMPSSHSGPVAVGDDWTAVWILGEDDAACISLVNSQIADELIQVLHPIGIRNMPVDELGRSLGLTSSLLKAQRD
ncbi:MAG: DUF4062 domain-containing protein [Dehalococcoidia bacterium]